MCMFDKPFDGKLPDHGYKVFYKNPTTDKLEFEYESHRQLKRRKWLTRALGTPGFHVFRSMRGARCWRNGDRNLVIKKVRIRGGLGTGTYICSHQGFRVREIFIP